MFEPGVPDEEQCTCCNDTEFCVCVSAHARVMVVTQHGCTQAPKTTRNSLDG